MSLQTHRPGRRGGPLLGLPRNVWVVTLTSFLNDLSSEMVASLLPLFLNNVLGARTAAIGLIEGVAEATASLVKIGSGWLSDRVGQRKTLAVAGYALSTVAKPLLFLATSWPAVLGVRFADRVGKGIRTAPRDALLADSTEASQRGLAFGIHRAGDTVGAVAGLLVALAVAGLSDPGARLLTRPVFQTLVVLGMVPAVLGVVTLAVAAREVPSTPSATGSPRPARRPVEARFRKFLLITVIFTLGNSSDAFLVLRAQQAGLSVVGVIGMMISFNLVHAAASGPAGALSDRLGRRGVIVTGWLVYALIYLGFATLSTGTQAWMLMTVYGLYYAATEGVTSAYVADLVPPGGRGTAYGVYNAAVGLSALPASLLAGILWQGAGTWAGFGPSAPFYLGAALALLAAALFVFGMPAEDVAHDLATPENLP